MGKIKMEVKNTIDLRPMQKIWVHVVLFFISMGIGNIIYYIAIKRKQEQWDKTIEMMNNR